MKLVYRWNKFNTSLNISEKRSEVTIDDITDQFF